MTVPTLAEFLLARIADDEKVARRQDVVTFGPERRKFSVGDQGPFDTARVIAECEAKRRIVYYLKADTHLANTVEGVRPMVGIQAILQHLAAVYSDHPDYQDEWRP